MSANLPDFDKAEYVAPPQASSYQAYSEPQIVSGDVDTRGWNEQRADHARFVQAIVYGTGAAIVGSILYAAFTIVTHIQLGYVAVGVGYLVGKAMLHATGGLGGRKYQVVAAVLTYFSVSMAAVVQILWAFRERGFSHINGAGLMMLAEYGVASPFLRLRGGLGALIGLFILFIGIRAAWSLTADRRVGS